MSARYEHGYDPAFTTVPQRSDHLDEISLCRAMQRWAIEEVDPRNNQRETCIGDWFGEEYLIAASTRTTHLNSEPSLNSTTKDNPSD